MFDLERKVDVLRDYAIQNDSTLINDLVKYIESKIDYLQSDSLDQNEDILTGYSNLEDSVNKVINFIEKQKVH